VRWGRQRELVTILKVWTGQGLLEAQMGSEPGVRKGQGCRKEGGVKGNCKILSLIREKGSLIKSEERQGDKVI
jgi:hypothetical protein